MIGALSVLYSLVVKSSDSFFKVQPPLVVHYEWSTTSKGCTLKKLPKGFTIKEKAADKAPIKAVNNL